MKVRIIPPVRTCSAKLKLASSKSISNRILIMHALANSSSSIINLSNSSDTFILQENLRINTNRVIDCQDAGTVFRFLTAYYSVHEGEYILKGTERMNQRPIGPLVEALRSMGAAIEYIQTEGFPPIRIKGGSLSCKEVSVDASVSSQFVSALMMIGPMFPEGLIINLKSDQASASYVQMTSALMQRNGATVKIEGSKIFINKGSYKMKNLTVEQDWSSASFVYELVALSPGSELIIKGLSEDSIQGDAVLKNWMKSFGVSTGFTDHHASIRSSSLVELTETLRFDCKSNPDLVPALVCTAAGMKLKIELSGVRNLRIKESDRIQALKTELMKFSVKVEYNEDEDVLFVDGKGLKPPVSELDSWNDHRIAMALAPLSIVCGSISINNPLVTAKSYPEFWSDMESCGFNLEFKN